MEWLARAVGAFYVVAGLIVIHTSRLELTMDRMLEALSQFDDEKPNPYEPLTGYGSLLIALLTLASGVALVGLSTWALPLFILCSLVQAAYLLLANRLLPPRDDDQALGRRRTTNAFVLYLGATAFVLWLQQNDRLLDWPPAEPLWIVGAGVALAAAYGLLVWQARRLRSDSDSQNPLSHDLPPAPEDGPGDDSNAIEPAPPIAIEDIRGKLRLAPESGMYPLWHRETGDNISPMRLPIPTDLAERIDQWDLAWQTLDPEAPDFATPEGEQRYVEEGRAIVQELEALLDEVDAPARFR